MNGRAEEYRRKAAAAKTAAQPDVKNQYLELARQWQELATHLEMVDRFRGK
jgi:hypothetical protein